MKLCGKFELFGLFFCRAATPRRGIPPRMRGRSRDQGRPLLARPNPHTPVDDGAPPADSLFLPMAFPSPIMRPQLFTKRGSATKPKATPRQRIAEDCRVLLRLLAARVCRALWFAWP